MTSTVAQTDEPRAPKPLRLWPGVVVVVVQWLTWLVLPLFVPDSVMYGMLAGFFGGVVIALWWLLFSRAPWLERVGALVLMIGGLFLTKRIVHPSVSNAGMGMMVFIVVTPVLGQALVAWAAASRGLAGGLRRASMVGALLLACGVFLLVRTGGMTGDGRPDLHWRWTPTPEERLLAQASDAQTAPLPAPAALAPTTPAPPTLAGAEPPALTSAPAAGKAPDKRAPAKGAPESTTAAGAPAAASPHAEWPGFRGPDRNSVVRGVRIDTDWSKAPPVALWRRPVGPAWSSFAVEGDLIYTQEQRGEDEVVSCYKLMTGEPVWTHKDAARFWESNAGAGPRGTPTLGGGRVYTLGATGILNALDARSGAVLWSRNAVTDTGAKIPAWGISSSPLVLDDMVIVAASSRLAAYDLATGKPRWLGKAPGGGYSSPQLATIGGVTQILLLNGAGAISVAPADGTALWKYEWSGDGIVQPALMADGDVLIGTGSGMGGETGVRRIAIAHGPGGWTADERWTSNGLKPYYNDFVVHKGHAFGFDGSILACIDLTDGKRKWKGGRYGHGQLVLLPDQDVLLVLSEDGELALVQATPDQFTELARVPAIESKTWNHPVLVGDIVLVRNSEEMAAFRVSTKAADGREARRSASVSR